MRRFIIRDDDCNFFTPPSALEEAFGSVWFTAPISLAVIPYVSRKWLTYVTRTHPSLVKKLDHPSSLETENPIGENHVLVEYLKDLLKGGIVSILQHGYSHELTNNHPEYESGLDLAKKTRVGKRHLEDIFRVPITCFVPPNNSISARGSRAVAEAGMNILTAYGPKPTERPLDWIHLRNTLQLGAFFVRFGKKKRYPYKRSYSTHEEFSCYSLGPRTSIKELKDGLDFAFGRKGDFCLATHWQALWVNKNLRENLEQIVAYAQDKWKGKVQFSHAGELFGGRYS